MSIYFVIVSVWRLLDTPSYMIWSFIFLWDLRFSLWWRFMPCSDVVGDQHYGGSELELYSLRNCYVWGQIWKDPVLSPHM